MSKLFENPENRKWLTIVLVLAALFIIAGIGPSTPEDMEMRLPVFNGPFVWSMMILIFGLLAYTWYCSGSDQENVDLEHPDGRLTYHKFSIGKLGWWHEKEGTKHE